MGRQYLLRSVRLSSFAARRKAAAPIRAEAEEQAADEAGRAEATQVLRDMETLHAW
jgi:hypothetical protein